MAICTPFNPCAVCGEPLGDTTDIIGFPDLVPMFSDFGDFYDACAHAECIKSWARRDEFVLYFNSLVDSSSLSQTWRLVVLPTGYVTYQKEVDRGAT